MPQYCCSVLTVTGDAESISFFRQRSRGISPYSPEEGVLELCFAQYVMPPEEIVDEGWGDWAIIWNWEHWGTKSNPQSVTVEQATVEDPDSAAERHSQIAPILAEVPQLRHGEWSGACWTGLSSTTKWWASSGVWLC